MAEIEMNVTPFGKVKVKIWPALVGDQRFVFAEMQDMFMLPLVSVPSDDARAFAIAIISMCDAADHSMREITKRTSPDVKP